MIIKVPIRSDGSAWRTVTFDGVEMHIADSNTIGVFSEFTLTPNSKAWVDWAAAALDIYAEDYPEWLEWVTS